MTTVNIIGAGRVGQSIAHCVQATSHWQLKTIYSRSQDKAAQAVKDCGGGHAVSQLHACFAAEVWFITVVDDAIADIAQALANLKHDFSKRYVFHTAGALPSTILSPLQKRGAYIASCHPVKAFPKPITDVKHWAGVYCAVEGNPKACAWIQNFFQSFGAKVLPLKTPQKLLYHAGAVMAAGHAVTLIAQSVTCFQLAGVDAKAAQAMALSLMSGALQGVENFGVRAALTGPVVRGDWALIADSEAALRRQSDAAADLYRVLTRAAQDLLAPTTETLLPTPPSSDEKHK